jgi:hypothetical protein
MDRFRRKEGGSREEAQMCYAGIWRVAAEEVATGPSDRRQTANAACGVGSSNLQHRAAGPHLRDLLGTAGNAGWEDVAHPACAMTVEIRLCQPLPPIAGQQLLGYRELSSVRNSPRAREARYTTRGHQATGKQP